MTARDCCAEILLDSLAIENLTVFLPSLCKDHCSTRRNHRTVLSPIIFPSSVLANSGMYRVCSQVHALQETGLLLITFSWKLDQIGTFYLVLVIYTI